MESIDNIVKIIADVSGKYSPYQVFNDWITCFGIAIANQVCTSKEIWQEREEKYLSVISKYDERERFLISDMCKLTAVAMEQEKMDILGYIFMISGAGNKGAGQFFSPTSVSELMARLVEEKIKQNGICTIHEPTIGSGGIVIELIKILEKRGVDYQKTIRVLGQDLDELAANMAYIQLSILGINAVIVQGDVLENPYNFKQTDEHLILRTPKNVGLL